MCPFLLLHSSGSLKVFLFLFGFQQFGYDMPTCEHFAIYPNLCSLSFLDLRFIVYHSLQKTLAIISSYIPSLLFLLLEFLFLVHVYEFVCLCLNFIFGNFYSPVFKLTHFVLVHVESNQEPDEDILHLYYSVSDFQHFNMILSLVSISAQITHLISYLVYTFH